MMNRAITFNEDQPCTAPIRKDSFLECIAFPRDGFCSLTRKAGLFAQGVYANGTRPEQKALLDAVSGQKTRASKRLARS